MSEIAFRIRSRAVAVCAFCFAVSSVTSFAAESAFYVASHGWHTSIIVPRTQVPARLWPDGVINGTFARYQFVELGWGDRKFYTAPHPDALMALDAVLLPGPSVLHVVGLNPPLEQALTWSALVPVPCSRIEMRNLCRALGDSFQRDAQGRVRPIAPGLYGLTSRFYPASGRYYLFNTCDTWTVRMMRAGGLDVNPDVTGTYSAGAVIAQARRATAARAAH